MLAIWICTWFGLQVMHEFSDKIATSRGSHPVSDVVVQVFPPNRVEFAQRFLHDVSINLQATS